MKVNDYKVKASDVRLIGSIVNVFFLLFQGSSGAEFQVSIVPAPLFTSNLIELCLPFQVQTKVV